MDVLYELQLDLQPKIAKAWSNFKKIEKEKMDKSKAITRLNNLEEKYKEFTSNHHKFITLKDCS